MNSVQVVIQTPYFPRQGEKPPEPAPFVLTEEELIRFCRLDEAGTLHPERAIARYREMGLLRGSKVGNNMRYTVIEAIGFMERLQQIKGRG